MMTFASMTVHDGPLLGIGLLMLSFVLRTVTRRFRSDRFGRVNAVRDYSELVGSPGTKIRTSSGASRSKCLRFKVKMLLTPA